MAELPKASAGSGKYNQESEQFMLALECIRELLSSKDFLKNDFFYNYKLDPLKESNGITNLKYGYEVFRNSKKAFGCMDFNKYTPSWNIFDTFCIIKFRILETLDFLAPIPENLKKEEEKKYIYIYCVICHVSCVTWDVSPITCKLSPGT